MKHKQTRTRREGMPGISIMRFGFHASTSESVREGTGDKMITKVTSLRQDTLDAYEAAKIADDAWQAELDAQKIDRYTLAARGAQGSELRRLRDAKCEADRKLRELTGLLRRYQDPLQVGITESKSVLE